MCGRSYFPLSLETPRWVLVARILRARGNKGEVAAEILTDFPERLTRLREVFVGHAGGKSEPRCMALKSCWLSQNHRGQVVFHFDGVDSISEAEKFRELEVLLPFEQRVRCLWDSISYRTLSAVPYLKIQPRFPSWLLRRARWPKRQPFSGRSSMCNFPEKRFPERRCWKCRLGAEKFLFR